MTNSSVTVLLVLPAFLLPAQTKTVQMSKNDSYIVYRLHHPLHNIEATSKSADCRIAIDPAAKTISTVSATVDVTSFDSGNSNRDSHAMEVVEALLFPDATFTSTSVVLSGDSLKASGTMTFHGVTNPLVIPAVVHWLPGKLQVDGNFGLSLTAYKIERPSLLFVPTDDTVKFTLRAVFTY